MPTGTSAFRPRTFLRPVSLCLRERLAPDQLLVFPKIEFKKGSGCDFLQFFHDLLNRLFDARLGGCLENENGNFPMCQVLLISKILICLLSSDN
jgi:hypothetical protein